MRNETRKTFFVWFVRLFVFHSPSAFNFGYWGKSLYSNKNQLVDNNSVEPQEAAQKQLGEQRSWTALKIQVFSVLRDGSERCVWFFDTR